MAPLLLMAALIAACSKEEAAPPPAAAQPEPRPEANLPLVVYATMPASRLQPVLDAYASETGKKARLVSGDKAYSAYVAGNGSLPDADLLLVSGLGEMWQLAEMDGFRPTYSESIDSNIPSVYRDAESRWTALGTNARIVVYNRELVDVDAIGSVEAYAALGDEQWRGRLCLSSSQVPGNQALVAFLIRQQNVRDAEILVRSWRANLATSIFANDSELIKAIAGGQCAIGIAGSNALSNYLSGNAGAPVAPHQFSDPESILVDASGGGVARHAHNPDDAADLLAWLTSSAPNALWAAQNQEFPANVDAPLSRPVEAWRDMVAAPVSMSALGFLYEDAVLLVERARYP